MPILKANDIEIAYESFGPEDGRPLILVRGLGTQMIEWEPRFLQMGVEGGHRVVIFDNRDVGLSTHFKKRGKLLAGSKERRKTPYLIDDMVLDILGLMDGLGIDSAHVAGISMGGMIVQQMAIRHPERTRSLISIMSSTGEPGLPGPSPEAAVRLRKRAPSEREAYVAHVVASAHIFAGPGFPLDEEQIADVAGQSFDRAYDPAGIGRQLLAVTASGSRREALANVRVPTLVIHGDSDPLIPLAGGEATANAIPNARLEIIPGLGHNMPAGVWPILSDLISKHTREAESQAPRDSESRPRRE